jgi:predicted transcriptional regulator of viral defense system
MTIGIGQMEAQALAYAQARDGQTIQARELIDALGWTAEQERKVLSRLARKRIIVRVRRGLYLVPRQLPQGGRWSPGEFLALTTLISDRGGNYQISGPSAFYRYGWTEQVPNWVYAYNNRLSGDRQIGPVALTLIKVTDDRLGAIEAIRTPEGIDIIYASKSRSLVDAVYDWSRFDSLPRAFEWIRTEVEKDDGFAAELVQTAIQFGNQGTLRRIGGLLERIGVQQNLLGKLKRNLRHSSTFIAWIPNHKKRGTTSNRWGIVFNDE